jgi:hypothetical protein
MIDKLFPLLRSAGMAISQHFAKHGTKYLLGGGTVVGGGALYAAGKSVGKSQGKREGTEQQATRDAKKIEEMHQQHKKDFKVWSEQKQSYKTLLDETQNNL